MEYSRNLDHRADRPGYALLLGLLMILVIGMIFYYTRMHGPVYQIGKGKSDIEVPWRQWHKIGIRLRNGPLGQPGPGQPRIAKALHVAAKPKEETQDRGQIMLSFLPDGSVLGKWGGQFFVAEKVDFQVMGCQFKGLVDPDKLFSDENGEDPAKLFFIAKGPFSILETNDKSGRVRSLGGDIYVRGWLGLDKSVDGEIILTYDEQNFYLYTWRGKAAEAAVF